MSSTIESISKHSLTKWYLYILRSICKQSKPRCRQITTPTPPHHSIFTSQTLFLMPNQQYRSTERQWNKRRKTRRNNSNHWPRLHEAQTTTVDNVFALWPHRQQCSADRPTATRNYTATHTHTVHTRLTALFLGLPGWAGTRKVKPMWTLLKQETVSGSGISWAICKSAPRSRQITTPTPQQSVFYRPDALPAAQPTASKHWRHKLHSKQCSSVGMLSLSGCITKRSVSCDKKLNRSRCHLWHGLGGPREPCIR